MMLNDSKDLLDNVEVTTIAAECVKLKQKEDEIASLEEQLKSKKAEADDIGSRVIPVLFAGQGYQKLNYLMDLKFLLEKNLEQLFLKMKQDGKVVYNGFVTKDWGTLLKTM